MIEHNVHMNARHERMMCSYQYKQHIKQNNIKLQLTNGETIFC